MLGSERVISVDAMAGVECGCLVGVVLCSGCRFILAVVDERLAVTCKHGLVAAHTASKHTEC